MTIFPCNPKTNIRFYSDTLIYKYLCPNIFNTKTFDAGLRIRSRLVAVVAEKKPMVELDGTEDKAAFSLLSLLHSLPFSPSLMRALSHFSMSFLHTRTETGFGELEKNKIK